MAEHNQSKAERRRAAGHASKAERKQAKLRREQRTGSARGPAEPIGSADDPSGDSIDRRLARLEQAVAAQSELSEQLLEKLDEVLQEARRSD